MKIKSRLPPYGWWTKTAPGKTIFHGWDWTAGVISLAHGAITYGFTIWIVESFLIGTLLWLAVSLPIAAGVGWRVTIRKRKISYHRTLYCIPLCGVHFDKGVEIRIENDYYVSRLFDYQKYIWMESPEKCSFGTVWNADDIYDAIMKSLKDGHE